MHQDMETQYLSCDKLKEMRARAQIMEDELHDLSNDE